nr:hypothetical protein [Sedimentibacter sp.]
MSSISIKKGVLQQMKNIRKTVRIFVARQIKKAVYSSTEPT